MRPEDLDQTLREIVTAVLWTLGIVALISILAFAATNGGPY